MPYAFRTAGQALSGDKTERADNAQKARGRKSINANCAVRNPQIAVNNVSAQQRNYSCQDQQGNDCHHTTHFGVPQEGRIVTRG